MTASVAAVTINFGEPDDTIACVRSLQASTLPVRIIVVDNASPAAARERLRRELPPECEVILSDRNLGFSGGNNLGIRRALERAAEFVLLINNDATLAPDALAALVQRARETASAGIVGGKILWADGSREARVWAAGCRWSPLRATAYPIGIGAPDRGQYDKAGEADALPACLWLIPAPVFERVGLLPEEHFLYGEDVDYCHMVRQAGYRLWYEPRAVCDHHVSGSHWDDRDRASPLLNYYTNRNRIRLARKWLTPLQRAVFYFYLLTSRAMLALVRGDRSYLSGLLDGWRGVAGPRPSPAAR